MSELVRQAEFGAWRLPPGRLANALAFELVGIHEIANAAAETTQKQATGRRPTTGEKGRLIDHREAELARGQNRARTLAAAAGVEIVTVKIEQHDPRPLDPFEQRVKPRRVEAPGIIKLVEAAESRRRG